MKITFVLPGVGGGGPRVIAEYAKGLLERGHDVRILYPVKSGVREILRPAASGEHGANSSDHAAEIAKSNGSKD